MYMKCKVTLLNHNYVIAPQHHKLTLSVIGDICVQEKDFSGDVVTYAGPTFCAIQSAKHSDSSAYHHLLDRKCVQSLDIFNGSFNNDTDDLKPVMIITIDGGPDDNTRYTKNIRCAVNYFTTQDLNAFFLTTNS